MGASSLLCSVRVHCWLELALRHLHHRNGHKLQVRNLLPQRAQLPAVPALMHCLEPLPQSLPQTEAALHDEVVLGALCAPGQVRVPGTGTLRTSFLPAPPCGVWSALGSLLSVHLSIPMLSLQSRAFVSLPPRSVLSLPRVSQFVPLLCGCVASDRCFWLFLRLCPASLPTRLHMRLLSCISAFLCLLPPSGSPLPLFILFF